VPALVEIHGIVKSYLSESLRPLRIRELTVTATDRLSLRGFDAGAAEMFVHLVTGAALPDEGTVRIAGTDTRDIATDTEWLKSLDRFGIVTHRAVLIDQISLASNLALPLTVSIDPMPATVREQIEHLASDAGFEAGALDRPVGSLNEESRLRLHLARAIANGPEMLMLEHPTAHLGDRDAAARIGETLGKLSETYRFGWIALTEDAAFAEAAGGAVLDLNAATGELAAPRRGWRTWFKR
jgi:ABC-type lipoprotein export system ATPase subunit